MPEAEDRTEPIYRTWTPTPNIRCHEGHCGVLSTPDRPEDPPTKILVCALHRMKP